MRMHEIGIRKYKKNVKKVYEMVGEIICVCNMCNMSYDICR